MVGLPKSGTTSIHIALRKIGIQSLHHEINGNKNCIAIAIATIKRIILTNI